MFARHYTTYKEMHEISAVRKIDAQLASNALVQTFLLQRNSSATRTSKTMITGLVTALDISLRSDHNTVTSPVIIV